MTFRGAVLAGLVMAGAVAAGPVGAGVAEGILPHRALYEIKLLRASSASEIVDVSGRMAFEWRDDCEGWAVEQKYLMAFSQSSGAGYEIRSQYTTWESKAGDVYQFIVERSGGTAERLEGRAMLPLPLGSGEGEALFSEPESERFVLGADVLFPTEHTLRLIDLAQDGKRFFRAKLFDGSELEAANLVSAVIGGPRTEPPPIEHKALEAAYWPIRLAFFDSGDSGSEPEFEMSVELLSNGIARRLDLDYSDFQVRMTLVELEALKRSDC